MKEKVSIIIPVYNSEKFLEETLQSILQQNYEPMELIIVNDGSTDSSEAILKQYELRDTRIHVINQRNGGPASARNEGIQHATGKYLMFFDSDDLMLEGAISILVQAMEEKEADLVMGGYIHWMPQIQNKSLNINAIAFQLQQTDYETATQFQPFPMNKMFRLDLIKENKIEFADCWRGEDLNFYLKYLVVAKKIEVVDSLILKYRWCMEGLSQTTSWKKLTSIIKSFQDTREYYIRHGRETDYILYIKKIELIHYYNALTHLPHISGKKQRYEFLTVMMSQIGNRSDYDLDKVGLEIYKKYWKINRKRVLYCSNSYCRLVRYVQSKVTNG